MNVAVRQVALPDFSGPAERPDVPVGDLERRCALAYERAQADWLVVYGDREHWGNLMFLTGYDPRFEEAVLVLGPDDTRALIVGNEGRIYAQDVPLEVDIRLCQTLSLMGQPRDIAPRLDTVLRDVGIRADHSVAIAGWKYLEPEESDYRGPAFVPAMLSHCVLGLTGREPLDATAVLMHPESGLRATVDCDQIAQWEYAAIKAARAVFAVIAAARPSTPEATAVSAMGYEGDPLSAHIMFASGANGLNGLRSPTMRTIASRDAVTVAIGYWGGLTCRAGVVDGDDQEFFKRLAAPYFRALAAWYSALGIGTDGGEVWNSVMATLDGEDFGLLLNPGHLIGHEEWTHSPFRPHSRDRLRSGMAFQSDIIPSPVPNGWAINAEDTLVLADDALRRELARRYPAMWTRIEARRRLLSDTLGITVRPEVLPLSPTCGYLPPWWSRPTSVCAMD